MRFAGYSTKLPLTLVIGLVWLIQGKALKTDTSNQASGVGFFFRRLFSMVPFKLSNIFSCLNFFRNTKPQQPKAASELGIEDPLADPVDLEQAQPAESDDALDSECSTSEQEELVIAQLHTPIVRQPFSDVTALNRSPTQTPNLAKSEGHSLLSLLESNWSGVSIPSSTASPFATPYARSDNVPKYEAPTNYCAPPMYAPTPLICGHRYKVEEGASTPQIVGFDNPPTVYKENKRIPIRQTPFAVRVDKEMQNEKTYREKVSRRLSEGRS